MTAAVVVQARMGSTRLPGKVLKPLAGTTVLAEVLRRCRAIPGIDVVCCATGDTAADDPVAAAAEAEGARVYRGAESDVLGRYAGAAAMLEAATVMRVTADCPLFDPALAGEVLALLRDEGADFAANDIRPLYPHGLDCEVFTRALLDRADREAMTARDREHVTTWMLAAPDVARAQLPGPGGAAAEERWTVDWPEDLSFVEAVMTRLPGAPAIPGWREVLAAIEADPALAAINRDRRIRRQAS